MKCRPVPKKLLERTMRMIETEILINNIKKKRCRSNLSRYLKKVVAWVEGKRYNFNMVSQTQFELIKNKYGHYASWAIWADEGKKPKDNVGDLSVFDEERNINLLHQLNPCIIMVGLNMSRGLPAPLANFHDARPEAMDYKIRYAFKGSPFLGAYMTDIIKGFEQKVSGKMLSYLRNNKLFEEKNVAIFREEIKDLGIDNPSIIAFGEATYTILNRNFKNEFKIIKIPHYSNHINKEKYREEVKSILAW